MDGEIGRDYVLLVAGHGVVCTLYIAADGAGAVFAAFVVRGGVEMTVTDGALVPVCKAVVLPRVRVKRVGGKLAQHLLFGELSFALLVVEHITAARTLPVALMSVYRAGGALCRNVVKVVPECAHGYRGERLSAELVGKVAVAHRTVIVGYVARLGARGLPFGDERHIMFVPYYALDIFAAAERKRGRSHCKSNGGNNKSFHCIALPDGTLSAPYD